MAIWQSNKQTGIKCRLGSVYTILILATLINLLENENCVN